LRPIERLADLRVANRLSGLVRHQILLGDVSDVLAVRILGVEVIERLLLGRTNLGGDRTPPFLGVGEDRIDVEDHTTEWVEPVLDHLSDPEFRVATLHGLKAPLPSSASYSASCRNGNRDATRNCAMPGDFVTPIAAAPEARTGPKAAPRAAAGPVRTDRAPHSRRPSPRPAGRDRR